MDDDALFAELIFWDAPSAGNRWEVIKQALHDAGLNHAYCPALSSRQLFSRATKTLKEDRTIDRIKDSGTNSWQFTRMRHEGDKIAFEPERVVRLDGDAVKCDADPEFAEFLNRAMAAEQDVRSGSDISRVVSKIYDDHMAMFPVVPRKGMVYVVPVEWREMNRKVESFLMGCGGKLHRFPVPKGDEKGKQSVSEAIDAGLHALLADIEAGVEEWDESTRKGTHDKAVQSIEILKLKAEHYANYLGKSKANLEAALAEAKAKIAARIQDLDSQRAGASSPAGRGDQGVQEASGEASEFAHGRGGAGAAGGGGSVSFASAAQAPAR